MALPTLDAQALQQRNRPFSIADEGGMTCVLLPEFELPGGYTQPKADLLLRLNPAYPDVPPDMWWFDPPVMRNDGVAIPATDHFENHLGRRWQRWSRHLPSGQWSSASDSIESFLAVISRELQSSSPVPSP